MLQTHTVSLVVASLRMDYLANLLAVWVQNQYGVMTFD
jgi:hypothetical protein